MAEELEYLSVVHLKSGEKELKFNVEDVVTRIVAAFGVQPPVYFVHEQDRTVVFPSENSGRFNTLVGGSTYEVQGNSCQSSVCPPSIMPYGAYPTMPPYTSISRPPLIPVQATKPHRRVIRKTIQVASVSSRDSDKPCSSKSSRMVHTIITQVFITLDPASGECNVSTAAEKVQKLLGVSVVILDSKLFPITDSESTRNPEFWKSTRKIIAISTSAYEKAGGIFPEKDIIDLEAEDPPQPKKAKIESCKSVSNSIVLKKLHSIDKKLTFVTELQHTCECVICHLPVRRPLVAPCCQRIIGCSECVRKWLVSNSWCPLCSVVGKVGEAIELKGIDDLVGIFRMDTFNQEGEKSSDSSDDFELPNVNVRRRPT